MRVTVVTNVINIGTDACPGKVNDRYYTCTLQGAETTRRLTPESITRKSPPSRLRGLGAIGPIQSLLRRVLGIY